MNAQDVIKRARVALDAESYEEGRKLLEAAVKATPLDVDLLVALTTATRWCERFSEAVSLARKALELAPGRHDAQMELGTSLRRNHSPFEALKVFEDLLAEAGDDVEGLRGKAYVLAEVGAPERALALFDQLAKRDPVEEEYVAGRALALVRMGQHRRARAILDKVLAQSPDFLRAQLWAAEACMRLHDHEGLVMHSAAASKLSPDVAATHLWAARATEVYGDDESREAHLLQAMQIDDREFEAMVELAIFYWEQGKADDAFPLLRKAEAIAPWSGFVQGVFAEFLLDTGRDGGHVDLPALIEKAKQQPASRLAYHVALIARERDERLSDAVALLRVSAEALPDDVSVRQAFAETLLLAGSWPEAEREARATLELVPHEAEAWRSLGFALEQQGRLADAIGAYEHAVKDDDKNELAAFALGTALVGAGRAADAVPYLMRAVELAPENEEFSVALRDAVA